MDLRGCVFISKGVEGGVSLSPRRREEVFFIWPFVTRFVSSLPGKFLQASLGTRQSETRPFGATIPFKLFDSRFRFNAIFLNRDDGSLPLNSPCLLPSGCLRPAKRAELNGKRE